MNVCVLVRSITAVWIGLHWRNSYEWTNATAPAFSFSPGLLPPPRRLCVSSVGLLVCVSVGLLVKNLWKQFREIFGRNSRNSRLEFWIDLDPDPGIFFTLLNIVK